MTRDIATDLAALGTLIERADAEAARLRAHRVRIWAEAHRDGMSWRDIAAMSGMDHAQIAKAVKRAQEMED